MLTCGLSSELASVNPQAEGADVIDDPENETLLDIQSFLQGFNFTMDTYGLPMPVPRRPPLPRLQHEEMCSEAQRQELQYLLDANLPTLNADQRNVHDTVLSVMADQSSPQVRLMRHHPALASWDRMLSRTLTFVCAPCSVWFSWMVQVALARPCCSHALGICQSQRWHCPVCCHLWHCSFALGWRQNCSFALQNPHSA